MEEQSQVEKLEQENKELRDQLMEVRIELGVIKSKLKEYEKKEQPIYSPITNRAISRGGKVYIELLQRGVIDEYGVIQDKDELEVMRKEHEERAKIKSQKRLEYLRNKFANE